MNKKQKTQTGRAPFAEQVARQEARKLRAQRQNRKPLWLGFSVTGLVGWGIVIPSLLGLALGVWIDSHHPATLRWTLMLFALGLIIGCFNAWHWISKEIENIRREQQNQTGETGKETEK